MSDSVKQDKSEEEAQFELFTSLRHDERFLTSEEVRALTDRLDWETGLYMLSHHRDRILEAARFFSWPNIVTFLEGPQGIERFRNIVHDEIRVYKNSRPQGGSASKVKVIISQSGSIRSEVTPAADVSMSSLFPNKLETPVTLKPMKTSPRTGGALTMGTSDHPLPLHSKKESGSEHWRLFIDTQPTVPSAFTSYKTTKRAMYDAARHRVGIKSYAVSSEVILYNTKGEVMEGSLTSLYFFREGQWMTPLVACGGQIGTTRRWLIDRKLVVEGIILKDSLGDGEECYISNGVRGLVKCYIQAAPFFDS